jgi:hypothetical protein
LGCTQLDVNQDGVFLSIDTRERILPLKFRQMDFELVLHRPIEATALIGQVSASSS